MDKNVIDVFWKKRSEEGKGRWTEDALLRYELGWLGSYTSAGTMILDLGSGPGELSSRLVPADGRLTMVEKYPGFLKLAPTGPNIQHVCCDVLSFEDSERYDLILIFGVITHLDEDEEILIYRNAAKFLTAGGTLVVKNQVSIGEEKLVGGYSASLQQDYCGRYPGLERQLGRLQERFQHVEIVRYPDRFNPWSDTIHVAFVCKNSV